MFKNLKVNKLKNSKMERSMNGLDVLQMNKVR